MNNEQRIVLKRTFPWAVVWVIMFTLILLFHQLFFIGHVSGESMSPTLSSNQIVLMKKDEPIKRFDIVALDERLDDEGENKVVIKRVIGLPGDVVTIINGKLYINNRKYDETYLGQVDKFRRVDWTTRVPEGYYFVLGDNRDVSRDSRSVGNFKESAIRGTLLFPTPKTNKGVNK